jgi:hypothetical protein
MLLSQVLSNDNVKFGYNAATGQYEDLMAAGIIDPTKVCSPLASCHSCLHHYEVDIAVRLGVHATSGITYLVFVIGVASCF